MQSEQDHLVHNFSTEQLTKYIHKIDRVYDLLNQHSHMQYIPFMNRLNYNQLCTFLFGNATMFGNKSVVEESCLDIEFDPIERDMIEDEVYHT